MFGYVVTKNMAYDSDIKLWARFIEGYFGVLWVWLFANGLTVVSLWRLDRDVSLRRLLDHF